MSQINSFIGNLFIIGLSFMGVKECSTNYMDKDLAENPPNISVRDYYKTPLKKLPLFFTLTDAIPNTEIGVQKIRKQKDSSGQGTIDNTIFPVFDRIYTKEELQKVETSLFIKIEKGTTYNIVDGIPINFKVKSEGFLGSEETSIFKNNGLNVPISAKLVVIGYELPTWKTLMGAVISGFIFLISVVLMFNKLKNIF